MKTGYKRLLVFIFYLMLITFVNTFIINFLSGCKMGVFVLFVLLSFNAYFIIEKNNERFSKFVSLETIIFLITFFILYYLLGFFTGLSKTPNYLTLNGVRNLILPILIYVPLREILRYNMLKKAFLC